MHSLGFKTSSKQQPPPPTTSEAKIQIQVLSETDKLNGNNEVEEDAAPGAAAAAMPAPVIRRAKPVCPAAKQPAARASMGSIIKGSVMDKVTHVFNNGVTNMGNSNSSSSSSANVTTPVKASSKAKEAVAIKEVEAIPNIPKGAVANGRAKFEQQSKEQKVSPEKPSRFFGSRSRTNSPMLPVKTPKVPVLKKDIMEQPNSTTSTLTTTSTTTTSAASSMTSTTATQSKTPPRSLITSLNSNKLLSKMKRQVFYIYHRVNF